jgi:hypothetical protein
MSDKTTPEKMVKILSNRFWPVVLAFAVLNAGGFYVLDLVLKIRVRDALQALEQQSIDVRANATSASRDALEAQRSINGVQASINNVNAAINAAEREAQKCLADVRERQREADKLIRLKDEITKAQKSIAEYDKIGETVEQWRKELLASSIHVGMAVPYFGDGEIPDGFIEIRTGKEWPKQTFMPEHLRGQKMDLGNDGWLLGSADNLKEVGRLYKDGKLTVDGSQFTIAEVETDRPTTPPPGWNAIHGVGAGDFDKRLVIEHQNGGQPIKAGERFGWEPPHSYKDKSAKDHAGGTCTVLLDKRESLPHHLMCRWILRVK